MKLQKLYDFISSLSPLAEGDWSLISNELTVIRYDAGVTLLSQHDVCPYVLFINSGIARSYVIDSNGRDYTCTFNFNEPGLSIKNVFLTDYASVVRGERSKLHFESLTDIEVVQIPVKQIKALYELNSNWSRLGRVIAEEAYYITQQRTLSLLTMTAAERYKELIEHIPSAIVQIPEHYIASYLGITPQSLSRIKKTLGVTK